MHKVYHYGYDILGQLTNASARLPNGDLWDGYQFSYAYDLTGNPLEQNRNGLVYSNSFNTLNQNVETRFAGALAALGNYTSPLTATVSVNNVQAKLFNDEWAAAGIPFVQGTNTLVTTILDLAGRTTSTTTSVTVADRTYAYDANGNMTANGAFTYVWDDENRLAEVWKSGTLVQQNLYDALSRRRQKLEYTADTATTNRYLYHNWLVLAITDGSNALLETYTHGLGISGLVFPPTDCIADILSGTKNIGALFYFYDYNGNIAGTTTTSAQTSVKLEYSPFGSSLYLNNPSRFTFSSKEADATDLAYYGYRYYSKILGRWISPDCLGANNSDTAYGFVGNSPNSKVDWMGFLEKTISFDTSSQGVPDGFDDNHQLDVVANLTITYDCYNEPQIVTGNAICKGMDCTGSRTLFKTGIQWGFYLKYKNGTITSQRRDGTCHWDAGLNQCVKTVTYEGTATIFVDVEFILRYLLFSNPISSTVKKGTISGKTSFKESLQCPCR